MKNSFFKILNKLLILSFFFSASSVGAAEPVDPKGKLGKFADTSGFGAAIGPAAYVGRILNIIYGFLGVAVLILFVYAGFLWMFAQGDRGKIQDARNIMTGAVIGLAVLLSAYIVTAFVISSLAGA